MAKSTDLDTLFQSLATAIAARLSEALVASMSSALASAPRTAAAAPVKRGPVRPPSGGKACLVSGCGKKPIAKGLCAGHYRKANRLGVASSLNPANLAKLAKDGRATRWAKK
jgi:hypothetical protein